MTDQHGGEQTRGRRTFSSLSFESLFFLKSSMSFSRRVISFLASFCLSLDVTIVSLNSAMAALRSATSAMTWKAHKRVRVRLWREEWDEAEGEGGLVRRSTR